jgi:hypothetical protein
MVRGVVSGGDDDSTIDSILYFVIHLLKGRCRGFKVATTQLEKVMLNHKMLHTKETAEH